MIRRALLGAALLACLGTAVAVPAATPAGAVQPEVCAQTSTAPPNPAFPCLNAWNGGPYVKSYTPGASNENFGIQRVAGRCDSTQLTTPGCPIAGIPAGFLIVQITHGSSCVGDLNGASGDAHAASNDTCNNPNTGQGGSFGTIYVYGATACPGGIGFWNAHWSGSWSGNMGGLAITSTGNGQQFWQNVHNQADCLTDF